MDTEINAKPAQAEAGVGAGAELGKNTGKINLFLAETFAKIIDISFYSFPKSVYQISDL